MSRTLSGQAMACVLGDMDLVRPLGLAGLDCAVVSPPGAAVTHSRYVRTVLPWDAETDPPDRLLDTLLRFGAAQREKPVLYFEEDALLLLVSRNRDRLRTAFRFAIAAPDLIEDLVDKSRFHRLAERLDLPVPPTCRLRPAHDPAPAALPLRFPIIVKPLTRCPAWDALHAGKALRIDSRDELDRAWLRLAATGLELLAQELIPGPETRIESYHAYVDEAGTVVGEFTGRKLRTYPQDFGHSTALVLTDEPDVAALGRAVVTKVGLTGVAKLDFKRAPDGRLYLLEINPRFNLWHHLGAVAGLNLPALVHADLTGRPRPATCPIRVGASWCHITKDRLAAREAGLPAHVWLSWMLRCDAKSLAWHDPLPFVRSVLSRIVPDRGPASEANLSGRIHP